MDVDARFRDAIQHFWTARANQRAKQIEGGKIDAGTRGAVTGGTQMGALEVLVSDILREAGLDRLQIKTRAALETRTGLELGLAPKQVAGIHIAFQGRIGRIRVSQSVS